MLIAKMDSLKQKREQNCKILVDSDRLRGSVESETTNSGGSLKPPSQQRKRTSPVKKVTILSNKSEEEELMLATPSERNWRGILIALLVIVAVLGMILGSIVLVSPMDGGPRYDGRRPTLQETLTLQKLANKPFNGTWISDTEIVYRDTHGGVSVFNAENMTTRVVMTNSTFRQINAVNFEISHDLSYVLLQAESKTILKYTTVAKYYVYEVATRTKFLLSPNDSTDEDSHLLQHAKWTPNGTGIVFVHDYDLYYKPNVRKSFIQQITNSAMKNNNPGSAPIIQNGIPDWLYSNEILHSSSAIWFSSNHPNLIAYLQFNNSRVHTYKYPIYNTPFPSEIREVKYPKVGTPNPNVTVWVVDLSNPIPILLSPPPDGEYVTSVKWFGGNVAVVWLNRLQNQSTLMFCKGPDFNCTVRWVQKSATWVHGGGTPFVNNVGDIVQLMGVREGEFGEWLHVCLIRESKVTPITEGKFEVVEILGWDQVNHIIYVISTPEFKSGERHLYRIGDLNSTIPWECLTCPQYENLTLSITPICLYNRIHLSPDFRYYIQECLGPSPPFVHLYETDSNELLQVLDEGDNVKGLLNQLAVPQVKNLKVEIEDGYEAQVKLLLPPGLREEEDVRYPFILLIDAAPGSQTVSSKFLSGWPLYLSSNKSYIVGLIDGRGSGFRGVNLRDEIHHRLGSVEVQDQLSVLNSLLFNFKFISATRICIVGVTSYGSYAALTLLATDLDKVINCTIALAPITKWRVHNTFFTERYLGQSPSDFSHADLITTQRAQSLISRRLLLAHGTADTEVHSQHSMALASILIKHEALFTYLTYPDTGHDFEGVENHLYKQIDQFIEDTFDLGNDFEKWDQTPPEEDSTHDFLTAFRQ